MPVTDVKALLGSLRRQGYILGAATNDSTRKMQRTVDYLDLADDLAFHCGADAGHGAKPDPGTGLAFCEQTGIPPERVLMVGDSIIDAFDRGHSLGSPDKQPFDAPLPCPSAPLSTLHLPPRGDRRMTRGLSRENAACADGDA